MNIKDVQDMNNQEVLVEIRYLLDQIQPIMNRLTQLQLSLSEEANETEEIPEYPIFNDEVLFIMSTTLRVFGPDRRTCSGKSSDYNAFHTKEYAEIFATKCREIAMLLHCKWYIDRDYIPDWKDIDYKYFVYLDPDTDSFEVVAQRRIGTGWVAFSTKENAQKAADWMNKHRDMEGDRT